MAANAPTAELQLALDFVNTRDVETGVDELRDPPALQAWLSARALLPAAVPLEPEDVVRAHEVREALRVVLRAHHGGDLTEGGEQLQAANAVLASVPLRIRLADDGRALLEPAGDGIEAALGRLLAGVPGASADGTWERMKVCPSDACQWAFFDQSRNRSRRWCSMEVCGNREKSRAFRARHGPAE